MRPSRGALSCFLVNTIKIKCLERTLALTLVALLCAVYVACTSCGGPGTPVTGGPGPTSGANDQSETAISVQGYGRQVITVTYNDGTGNDGKIVYTPTQRTVFGVGSSPIDGTCPGGCSTKLFIGPPECIGPIQDRSRRDQPEPTTVRSL